MSDPLRYVLDTNTVSALVHRVQPAIQQFNQQMGSNAIFLLCPVVWYEMQRGLLRVKAAQKLQMFEQLAATFDWGEIGQTDWQLAAAIWPQMVTLGQQPSDADLLIAAFAARHEAILVTQNLRHFQPLSILLNFPIQTWI